MKPIQVSAPGKLHLLGEHAVVYGKPAIIAAIDKRCFVEITPKKHKKIEIASHNLKISKVCSEKEIITKTKEARSIWETYIKNNDISLLKSITSHPLDFSIIVIGETISYFKKSLPFGFTLSIKSYIPVGCGMGSSAALAVCIAGVVSLFLGKGLDKEAINSIAFVSEQRIHGFPSGGDNAASCFGGLIWYRKETPDFKIIKPIPFAVPKNMADNFVVINTGIPVESTGEMVSIARSLYEKKQELVESILSSQAKLTRELLFAIKKIDGALMIRIIRAGEKNLESLGVVSEFTKLLIRSIEKIGGAAKICGAGGRQQASGVVLAYHKDPQLLKDIVREHNLNFQHLMLGEEGVRKD